MPTSADDGAEMLVDTSAAIALLVADHDQHEPTFGLLSERRLGLAGHALFETFSVLTRLPSPARRSPASASRLIQSNFQHSRHLSPAAAVDLFDQLAVLGIAGGAVYDALVGATAREWGLPLATRDRRALTTYHALGVQVHFIGV